MKYLDALLKAGIIVMLYLILMQLISMGGMWQDGFVDVHLVRHELQTLNGRLDSGIIRFEVKGKGG